MKLKSIPRNQTARKISAALLVAGAMGCASAQQKPEAPAQKAETTDSKKPIDMRGWRVSYESDGVRSGSRSYPLAASAKSHGLRTESESHPLAASYGSSSLHASYSYAPGPMHGDNPEVDASMGSGRCSTHTNIERRKVKVGDWVQGLGTLLRHDEKLVVFECFPAVEGGYGSVDLREFDGPNIQATFEKAETPGYMYVTVTVGK